MLFFVHPYILLRNFPIYTKLYSFLRYNTLMNGNIPQSTVARPKIDDALKKRTRSHTSDDKTEARIIALAEKYDHTRAAFIEKVLRVGMDAIESDPNLLLGGKA